MASPDIRLVGPSRTTRSLESRNRPDRLASCEFRVHWPAVDDGHPGLAGARAILCPQCNTALGMLRDDPALVRAAGRLPRRLRCLVATGFARPSCSAVTSHEDRAFPPLPPKHPAA